MALIIRTTIITDNKDEWEQIINTLVNENYSYTYNDKEKVISYECEADWIGNDIINIRPYIKEIPEQKD